MSKSTEALLELPDDVLQTLAEMKTLLIDPALTKARHTEVGQAVYMLGHQALSILAYDRAERTTVFADLFEEDVTPAQTALIAQAATVATEIEQLGGLTNLDHQAFTQIVVKHVPGLSS